jgi:hypothetical protein
LHFSGGWTQISSGVLSSPSWVVVDFRQTTLRELARGVFLFNDSPCAKHPEGVAVATFPQKNLVEPRQPHRTAFGASVGTVDNIS